ncbi:ATP-binding protein [Granulicella sp. 5B5]|uniref:ATP-binding protein n=1 Tax=Granulicella sp. 5B5 TaxID=1617967 RepID=UPI0015F5E6AC|nr:ATP-binding protein [Granulicella sp. 5B5]
MRLLLEIGLRLYSERSLDAIAQCTLEGAVRVCGAEFGLFLYYDLSDDGEVHQHCRFAGMDTTKARDIATLTELAQILGEQSAQDERPSHTRGLLRIMDLESAAGREVRVPFSGLPPLRSYLVVPVRMHNDELIGVLVCGHAKPNSFGQECEEFVATVAAQAAVTIENFRLNRNVLREIEIADRARALQRETEDRLRQALEAAQLGTWSWDRRTDLLELDDRAAGLFGVAFGVPLTRTALREHLVVPEDRNVVRDSLQESLDSGRSYVAEYRIERAGGTHIWVSASGVPVFVTGAGNDRGDVVGMVGTVQDVTARKGQEHTLRESEKLAATGRLAATIAHEINNPLEAVTNLIYLARTDTEMPVHVQQLLDTADSELARVSQLAQQTLGFYRDTTRLTTIDLNKLLLDTVDLFTRKMRSKGVACTMDLEPGLALFGLQGEIRQVFSNLLVNAIDASTRSTIHIRGRRRRQCTVEGIDVVIADHGEGIPVAVRRQLFTPFVTTKETAGTGLGLWVTRGIVEKQGGSVRFRTSTTVPTGTIFRVFLPVRPPSAETASS